MSIDNAHHHVPRLRAVDLGRGVDRPGGAARHLALGRQHAAGGRRRCTSSINKFPLAAVPFFILAGNLMETAASRAAWSNSPSRVVGGVQGGLAGTCVLTCMIFAAVSGSSVATTFAIGAILIPAMVQHGYPITYAAALQATAAELGVIIPPSIPMIIYGVAAEVSIGELFIAGFGPGLLIGGALMAFVLI